MASVNPKVLTLMMDVVNFGRIGVDLLPPIFQHRVIFPARLPQLVADLEVFVGEVVALVVIEEPGAPEVAARTFEIGCDDVPRDSALRQVIERRDLPREGEWMTLQHRARVR